MIFISILNRIYIKFQHLVETFKQSLFSHENFNTFSRAVHEKDAPLDFCWGFKDGTIQLLSKSIY